MDDVHSSPLVFKIHGGTPRSDVNLCLTCSAAHVVTGASGQKSIRCDSNYSHPVMLREAVVSCNRYFDRTKPSLHQMQEIAWTLMTDKGGRQIGFAPPDRERAAGVPPSHGF